MVKMLNICVFIINMDILIKILIIGCILGNWDDK